MRLNGRIRGTPLPVLGCFLVIASVLVSSGYSQTAVPPPETGAWKSFLSGSRVTGDWAGVRSNYEEQGLRFRFFANHFFSSCGRCPGSPQKNSGSFDFFVFLDTEQMGGWAGGEFMMLAKANSGVNLNRFVAGLSDPIDDADFTVPAYIDQLWYQHSWNSRKIQLRVGYLDLQTIIDRNRYANSEDLQFMTTQLDNNNAIIPLKIGLGAALFFDPVDWLSFRMGVSDDDNRILLAGFDTAFDGLGSLLIYLESGIRLGRSDSRGGNYRFGVFYDPTDKTPFLATPGTKASGGDVGFFVSADQKLLKGGGSERELGLFVRYGFRDSQVNRISQSWSAGLQISALAPWKRGNYFGLGFYHLDGSSEFREARDAEFQGETGLEIYYRLELTPWLSLTPDLQFLVDPGGSEAARNLFVPTLRTRLEF